MKSKEIKIGKSWVGLGLSFNRFGVGICIDRYHIDIDFIFFWISWEF